MPPPTPPEPLGYCAIVVGRTVQSWLNSTSAAPLCVVRNPYGIYKVTDRVMQPETQREIAADLDPTSGTKLLIRTVTHGTTHHGAQVQHPRAGRRPPSRIQTIRWPASPTSSRVRSVASRPLT